MNILSAFKSSVLQAADGFNAVIGGPRPFTRNSVPDPSGRFMDDMTRRDYIAELAEIELERFTCDGVFFSQIPNDLGDACIWQGVYTAMCALRWNAKRSQRNADAILAATSALSRYFYPTGPGRAVLMRGAVPQTLEHEFFSVDPNNGGHYFTDGYLGNPHVYRDDASLDSLLGAMFGAAMVQRFGNMAAREILEYPLSLFSTAFKESGFRLPNRDGSRTRYGDCAPGFFQAPVRILAATLPSLLSDGDIPGADWRKIARAYAPEFATTDTQIPGKISYVNAHLAMLANLTYICAAPTDAPGVKEAVVGLRTLMAKYADAGNAFLIYAAAVLGVAPSQSQKDKADKILIEFPIGPKPKAGLNSSSAPALQPVPVWQRPPVDYIFQRSPYPYSGSETATYSRLDYLIAHYAQRSLT